MDLCDGQLRLYSNVKESNIDWLWYPYIPFGKITLLQGDPGCGKSTLMMSIIASVTTGLFTQRNGHVDRPMNTIYQCSEDGVSDTIKPRLIAAGADCSRVAFLDEELNPLTLDDEQLRRAIADFNAKLLVIDPIQAYLGTADLANAMGIRKMLRSLAQWASMYRCAIVLIGHLNKRQGTKELYRTLGSIDLAAAARSIIHLEVSEEDPGVVELHHVKCSLAPRGEDDYFTITDDKRIIWLERTVAPSHGEKIGIEASSFKKNKQQLSAELIVLLLQGGPMKAADIQASLRNQGISTSTLNLVKRSLGIRSFKDSGSWFWALPDDKTVLGNCNRYK